MTIMPDAPTTALSTAGTSATIHAQVAAAAIDECELLLLADVGEALVLNESAALLWQGIEAGEEVGTLTTRLTAQYDVPTATAEQDVLALLATLAEAGAIVMA